VAQSLPPRVWDPTPDQGWPRRQRIADFEKDECVVALWTEVVAELLGPAAAQDATLRRRTGRHFW